MLAAQGEAEATLARAHSSAAALEMLSSATGSPHGAVSLRIAEQYIGAFGNIAQKGNLVVLPADTANIGGMVASALGVYSRVREMTGGGGSGGEAAEGGGAGGSSSSGGSGGSGGGGGGFSSGSGSGSRASTSQLHRDALEYLRSSASESLRGASSSAAQQAALQQQQQQQQQQEHAQAIAISSDEAAQRVGGAAAGEQPFVPAPFPKM